MKCDGKGAEALVERATGLVQHWFDSDELRQQW